ncbi:acyltransferase family protein [Leucobacter sp.]
MSSTPPPNSTATPADRERRSSEPARNTASDTALGGAPATDPGAAPAPRSHAVRRDIQGLRAIAVALVLVYHLSPQSLSGGYIGVDVFFVISGFLITGQLLREAEASGRIDLPRFWARRARRLLPAALLVLTVTLLAVWIFAPRGFLPSFLMQVAASAAYVQNWVLSGQSVDYMAAEAQVSPVQHYWSLSVEEQFYILWPLIAVLAAVLAARAAAGRGRAAGFRAVFALLVGAIALASFVLSVLTTATDPSRAYFVTTTRAWEFAVGGLLACLAASPAGWLDRAGPGVRALAAWIGLAGIAAAAILYTDTTPFPGYTALLPVLATALVIAAQEPETSWSPRALLAARPMQWLGDVSYGAYLWHFPLIVLLPFALGRRLGLVGAIAIVAATLLLAWGSKVLVEDPFRTGFSRAWPNGRAIAITSAGMVAMLLFSLAGVQAADRAVEAERVRVAATLEDPDPCLGATALEPDSGCEATPEQLPIPEPALADKAPERCLDGQEGSELELCEYGSARPDAERTVALVGDSHAEQWLLPLDRIAREQNWRLVVMAKASCPFTAAERDFVSSPEAENEKLREDCTKWNDRVLEQLEGDPSIDTVVTSAKSSNRVVPRDGRSWRETAVLAYEERWRELPDSVEQVIAIRDTPQLPRDVLQCVTEEGEHAARECAVDAEEAITEDPLAEAASATEQAELIDLSEYFVVGDAVPPVIGGVLAFRDSHHLSWAYAEMLADPLAEQVREVLGEDPEADSGVGSDAGSGV